MPLHQPQADFAVMVEWLWSGEIGQDRFVRQSIEIGIPQEKIDAAIEDVRRHDFAGEV